MISFMENYALYSISDHRGNCATDLNTAAIATKLADAYTVDCVDQYVYVCILYNNLSNEIWIQYICENWSSKEFGIQSSVSGSLMFFERTSSSSGAMKYQRSPGAGVAASPASSGGSSRHLCFATRASSAPASRSLTSAATHAERRVEISNGEALSKLDGSMFEKWKMHVLGSRPR